MRNLFVFMFIILALKGYSQNKVENIPLLYIQKATVASSSGKVVEMKRERGGYYFVQDKSLIIKQVYNESTIEVFEYRLKEKNEKYIEYILFEDKEKISISLEDKVLFHYIPKIDRLYVYTISNL